jgi:hypothetical protein
VQARELRAGDAPRVDDHELRPAPAHGVHHVVEHHRVRLSGVLSPSAEDAFRRLVLDVNRASFGRGGLPRVDIDRAVSDARAVRKSAWRRVSWRQRLVAELDPRDLLSAA